MSLRIALRTPLLTHPLISDFATQRDREQLDEQALEATTSLLTLNPELYTVWNYRRRIISHLVLQPPHEGSPSSQSKSDFFASARIAPTEAQTTSSAVSEIDYQTQLKLRLLEDDLELTQHALRAHPKVYWIWNHRKWCLIELPEEQQHADEEESEESRLKRKEKKWRVEMRLVDKMLELDSRNFHVWDYRRYLLSQIALASLPASSFPSIPPFPASLSFPDLPSFTKFHHLSLAKSELRYTTSKIEANFSNFSAWHWRSKLLPPIWAAEERTPQQRKAAREEELELVRQAMYTDPEDQSVWLYHGWLVQLGQEAGEEEQKDLLQREIESIEELSEVEPDCRFCIEALSRYKTQLAALTGSEQTKEEVRDLLERLIEVDPDRAGRYRDQLEEAQRVKLPIAAA